MKNYWLPRRWWYQCPPKRWYLLTNLQGVISLKTEIFINTADRTSNLAVLLTSLPVALFYLRFHPFSVSLFLNFYLVSLIPSFPFFPSFYQVSHIPFPPFFLLIFPSCFAVLQSAPSLAQWGYSLQCLLFNGLGHSLHCLLHYCVFMPVERTTVWGCWIQTRVQHCLEPSWQKSRSALVHSAFNFGRRICLCLHITRLCRLVKLIWSARISIPHVGTVKF